MAIERCSTCARFVLVDYPHTCADVSADFLSGWSAALLHAYKTAKLGRQESNGLRITTIDWSATDAYNPRSRSR